MYPTESSTASMNKPTPLHLLMNAIAGKQADVVEGLLEQGEVNINSRYQNDMMGDINSPLNMAAICGYTDIAKMLLDHGADPDMTVDYKNTALMNAVYKNHAETAHVLIEAGADLEMKDSAGVTALMCAAEQGKMECVKLLLEKGADLTHESVGGMTAVRASEANGHQEIADLLRATIVEREIAAAQKLQRDMSAKRQDALKAQATTRLKLKPPSP